MPMTYTAEMVREYLELSKLSTEGTEAQQRERLARRSEYYKDYLEAWEIRTGRPWISMTPEEAKNLLTQFPTLSGNPGLISRLRSKG